MYCASWLRSVGRTKPVAGTKNERLFEISCSVIGQVLVVTLDWVQRSENMCPRNIFMVMIFRIDEHWDSVRRHVWMMTLMIALVGIDCSTLGGMHLASCGRYGLQIRANGYWYCCCTILSADYPARVVGLDISIR